MKNGQNFRRALYVAFFGKQVFALSLGFWNSELTMFAVPHPACNLLPSIGNVYMFGFLLLWVLAIAHLGNLLTFTPRSL